VFLPIHLWVPTDVFLGIIPLNLDGPNACLPPVSTSDRIQAILSRIDDQLITLEVHILMREKSIFVTGAASGIGRATADLFHEKSLPW
jgi:hypothetical protein